jgi:hypothetical protein
MPTTADSRLLFDLPNTAGPIYKRRLKETGLLGFYEENNEDFSSVILILYFGLKKKAPNIGEIANRKAGFACFCDYVTAYFLAAPTLGHGNSTDEAGLNVNFFGEALLLHLDRKQIGSLQNLYGGGAAEASPVWYMVRDLVYFAGVEALGNGEPLWDDNEDKRARARIKELIDGKRSFKGCNVPKRDNYFQSNVP